MQEFSKLIGLVLALSWTTPVSAKWQMMQRYEVKGKDDALVESSAQAIYVNQHKYMRLETPSGTKLTEFSDFNKNATSRILFDGIRFELCEKAKNTCFMHVFSPFRRTMFWMVNSKVPAKYVRFSVEELGKTRKVRGQDCNAVRVRSLLKISPRSSKPYEIKESYQGCFSSELAKMPVFRKMLKKEKSVEGWFASKELYETYKEYVALGPPLRLSGRHDSTGSGPWGPGMHRIKILSDSIGVKRFDRAYFKRPDGYKVVDFTNHFDVIRGP